jgi:hypothetical protein
MDDFSTMEETGALALLAGLGLIFAVVGLVFYLFYGFCYGKMFEKAGKPMWAGFVPVYNLVVWLEIIGRPWWWVLVIVGVSFVPFVGTLAVIALMIVFGIDTARSFGKDTAFGVLFAILSFIFLPILAFSSEIKYVGPRASGLGAPPLEG